MANSSFDLIVIGAGPAGMMAAGRAVERGRRVLLIERGPSLGRKLLMTGGGRCNVTNAEPLADFMKRFGRHGEFLRDAFAAFSNSDFLDWLHSHGVPTVELRGGCLFPESQDAHTVLQALQDYMAQGGVTVATRQRVMSLWMEGNALAGVKTEDDAFRASRVLVATGGLSYPATGSTGDGYALARQVGHEIVPTFAAVAALETKASWPRQLQGTPVKNVRIRASAAGRKLAEVFGEALWTHYGISGPAVLDISRDVALALRKGDAVTLELDLRPNDAEESLDERLLFAIKKKGKQQVATVVSEWVTERTARTLLELAEVDPRLKMSQCSKAHRRRIVKSVKQFKIEISDVRPVEEAIVTGGGVSLKEVDPKHMESRLLKGLYFAGEVLDLDAPCGGYNLQAAFSTGRLVGDSI